MERRLERRRRGRRERVCEVCVRGGEERRRRREMNRRERGCRRERGRSIKERGGGC